MDARGRELEACPLTEKGDRVRQFLPHPNGHDLLVLTGKQLLWLSWS